MKPRLDEHYKLFIDGKWVASSCGQAPRPSTLKLGGKSANIFFPDAP